MVISSLESFIFDFTPPPLLKIKFLRFETKHFTPDCFIRLIRSIQQLGRGVCDVCSLRFCSDATPADFLTASRASMIPQFFHWKFRSVRNKLSRNFRDLLKMIHNQHHCLIIISIGLRFCSSFMVVHVFMSFTLFFLFAEGSDVSALPQSVTATFTNS